MPPSLPAADRPRRPAALAAVALAMAFAMGCAGYRVGASSLYAPDVRTVYVPMIESDSYRRDLGERLTESVIKEIELKTPYKVVASPNADSVLEVRLHGDRRGLLGEDALDNPRILENYLNAVVTWQNRRRVPLVPVQTLPIPGGMVQAGYASDQVGVEQASILIPEAGQSVASQQQLAITRLAEQIVATMETPW